MQVARRHHYVPKFYLKRWTTNGKVVEFARHNQHSDRVTCRSKAPEGAGWAEDLYALRGLPPALKDQLERLFFSPVDGIAADALSMMEAGLDQWTDRLRQGWTMFILSMAMRHPSDIVEFTSKYAERFRFMVEGDEERYQSIREAGDPLTAAEFLAVADQNYLENRALSLLPRLVNHRRTVQGLMNMAWHIVELPADAFLVTSDRPTLHWAFLGTPQASWQIPLGPGRHFIACSSVSRCHAVDRSLRRGGWQHINRLTARNAFKYGYSDRDTTLTLFQRHLGRSRRPSFFSEFSTDPRSAPELRYPVLRSE